MASIKKRGNSYLIIVSKGYDSSGKKLSETKTVKLDNSLTEKQQQKELEKLALEFEMEVERGTRLDGEKITFAEFVEQWLLKYAEQSLEPKTLYRYKEMLSSRILPAIGHIKLSKLQPTNLLSFYNNLGETGIRLDTKYIAFPNLKNEFKCQKLTVNKLVELSKVSHVTIENALKNLPITQKSAEAIAKAFDMKLSLLFQQHGEPGKLSSRTILHHHRLISSILQSAVYWQLIISNPADRVKPPKTYKAIVPHYDENQTKALLKALDQEPLKFKTMVLLDVFSGLRLGELMGLSWNNIDFKNSTIEVNKASQYISGRGNFEKKPKNETSVRKVSVPSFVMGILEAYKAHWIEEKNKVGDLWKGPEEIEDSRLFVTWEGKPMFTYTLTNWFPEFLERHNLPKITPHGLRHTSATLLAASGAEISMISKRLGHARTSTTMDIYVHALKSSDVAASNLLEKTLLGEDNKPQLIVVKPS